MTWWRCNSGQIPEEWMPVVYAALLLVVAVIAYATQPKPRKKDKSG